MARALFNSKRTSNRIIKAGNYIKTLFDTGAMKRIIGSKPIWAQLKITERCNLNCGYCHEHCNSGHHVPADTVTQWIAHCHELGVTHVEFIGGEPLMHPNLLQFLSGARKLKMNTGLTTNGFLLTPDYARWLLEKGMSRLQLSIDCVEPNSVTRKALNLLKPQLALLGVMDIYVHVNSVLTPETLHQARVLAHQLFKLGIPVAFSPAHDHGRLPVDSDNCAVLTFLDWLLVKKKEGYPINMPSYLINYFRDALLGKPVSWICEGGCKAFYVDSDGGFRICSHSPACIRFEDVDSDLLKRNHRRIKGCENRCGVGCMIASSIPYHRLDYVIRSTRKSAQMPVCMQPEDSTCTA